MLIAAVGALMLIACANVSNLLLARGVLRRRDVSIRAALGATRRRVVRLLLIESLLLALSAGAVGTVLAAGAMRLFARSTARRRALRQSLVAFEIAASLILLTGVGLLARSCANLAGENPGFRREDVLCATLALPPAQYRLPQRLAFTRALLDRTNAMPGVLSAAVVDVLPYRRGSGSAIQIPGNPDPPGEVGWQTHASPDFFRTMGIRILRGRDFLSSEEALGAAVIDENVARKFFNGLDPIGRTVTLPLAGGTFPVVGVVGAVKSNPPAAPPLPLLYYAGPQWIGRRFQWCQERSRSR